MAMRPSQPAALQMPAIAPDAAGPQRLPTVSDGPRATLELPQFSNPSRDSGAEQVAPLPPVNGNGPASPLR